MTGLDLQKLRYSVRPAISQRELARALGMVDRQISNWETSERPLSKRNALAARAAIDEILRRRGV